MEQVYLTAATSDRAEPQPADKQAPAQYSVTIARSMDEALGLRKAWEEMQFHPNAELDFYRMIVSMRPEVLRPHIIVLYERGTPKAMLVGRLERTTIEFKIGYKTAARTKVRMLTVIYGGRMGEESATLDELLVRELIASLKQAEADVVLLSQVRVDSPLYAAWRSLPGVLWRDHFPVRCPHWQMSLDVPPEQLMKGLSNGTRWQFRKLQKDHPALVIKEFVAPGDVDALCSAMETVAAQTYQRGLGAGFVDNSENRNRFLLAARQGRLRAYVLANGQEPFAFWVGTRIRDVFYADFTGYASKLKKYSPGTFLFFKTLQALYSEGIRTVDFGFGDAFYKQRFGNKHWDEAATLMVAPTFRGLGIVLLRTGTTVINRAANKILARMSLLQRVKTSWRGRAQKHLRGAQPARSVESGEQPEAGG